MISETIKRKAKAKINLGVDPLKVHEWLMQQGCDAEEEEKMREATAPQLNTTKGI